MIQNEFWFSLSKIFSFSSRATRREFLFTSLTWLRLCSIYALYYLLGTKLGFYSKISLFFFVIVITSLASIGVRRCHDTGHGFWVLLIPGSIIYLLFRRSIPQTNKWGTSTTAKYKPSDFETTEDYYNFLDSRVKFKGLGIKRFIFSIARISLVLGMVWLVYFYADPFIDELMHNYVELKCSKSLYFEPLSSYQVSSNSVRDICVLCNEKDDQIISTITIYEVDEQEPYWNFDTHMAEYTLDAVVLVEGIYLKVEGESTDSSINLDTKTMLNRIKSGGLIYGKSDMFNLINRLLSLFKSADKLE